MCFRDINFAFVYTFFQVWKCSDSVISGGFHFNTTSIYVTWIHARKQHSFIKDISGKINQYSYIKYISEITNKW